MGLIDDIRKEGTLGQNDLRNTELMKKIMIVNMKREIFTR